SRRPCARARDAGNSRHRTRRAGSARGPRLQRSFSCALAQLVRVAGGEIEPVDRSQRADLLQRALRERRLALEGVQDDALEQIAEREVELGRERLQHLEQPALEAHAGLGAGDLLDGTMVPSYHSTIKRAAVPPPSAVSDAAPACFDRRAADVAPS